MKLRFAAMTLLLSAFSGCSLLDADGRRPARGLPTPGIAEDTLALHVFFVSRPLGDPLLNDQLWREVDELAVQPATPGLLRSNGFRIGVVGSQPPPALERILGLGEGAGPEGQPTDDAEQTTFTGWHRQFRSGGRITVLVSGPHAQLPMFVNHGEGSVRGETFEQAQCVLQVGGERQPDGRVRLHFVPEVQHGPARMRVVPGPQGQGWVYEPRPDSRTLDALAWELTLSPGEMVLVHCPADKRGTLGDHFFTEASTGPPEQKLIIIQLAHAQPDTRLFEGPE